MRSGINDDDSQANLTDRRGEFAGMLNSVGEWPVMTLDPSRKPFIVAQSRCRWETSINAAAPRSSFKPSTAPSNLFAKLQPQQTVPPWSIRISLGLDNDIVAPYGSGPGSLLCVPGQIFLWGRPAFV
jgi:hypothetical protein